MQIVSAAINEFLTKHETFTYRPTGETSNVNFRDTKFRASGLGKCTRALAYQLLGFEKEPFRARFKLVCEMGNLAESMLAGILTSDEFKEFMLLEWKGPKFVFKGSQQEVLVNFGDVEVSGHIDGYLQGENNKQLIDFKTINTRGFSQLHKNGEIESRIDYKYILQAHCYMKAFDLKSFRFVFLNKDTQHLTDVVIEWDDKYITQISNRLHKAVNATLEALPEREHLSVNKDFSLGWRCSYCDYNKYCINTIADLAIEAGEAPSYKLKSTLRDINLEELKTLGVKNEN